MNLKTHLGLRPEHNSVMMSEENNEELAQLAKLLGPAGPCRKE